MKDEILMDFALKEFQSKAKAKFEQGIKEHNPNGDKGLERMTSYPPLQCVSGHHATASLPPRFPPSRCWCT